MCSIMDLIGPERSDLVALEFANIAESDFVYTLAFTNVEQLVPNMVTIYMAMTSWMSSIISQSDSNNWSYLPLNKETLFNFTLFIL